MQSPEPLIEWSELLREYIGFIAQFLALGAIGFRFAALRNVPAWNKLAPGNPPDSGITTMLNELARRAARLGLLGFAVQTVMFFMGLPAQASRAHTTVTGLIATLPVGVGALLFVAGVVGLGFAAMNGRGGWTLAAVAVVFAPLTGVLSGDVVRLVNPGHRVVAGLWIGTLFYLVLVGIAGVLRDQRAASQRGALAASMVHGFSPLALTCGMFVVATGLITAWRHLNPLSSLWTTPYGYALIVKLAFVAVVFALGAWNWQRQRPRLGSEEAAQDIRRSGRAELAVAALVLAATTVVVSLPAPRRPGPPPAPPGQSPAAAPSATAPPS